MKALIVIFLVLGAAFIGWKLYEQYDVKEPEVAEAPTQLVGTQLPGLPPALEYPLSTAQQQGATGLRNFLAKYGKGIRDPRLAWIELDYAVLMMRENPAEAKRIFARVKKRTPISSPVYPRIKQLEKTYE
ncbi:MAG: hypothetical protein H0X66_12530 [Verrucomicrobia bacterium]|nr:hypothetical protein [Verrucomicrobiota bacterium]